MIFHENRLPADDSHEISSFLNICRLLQIIGGALWVNPLFFFFQSLGSRHVHQDGAQTASLLEDRVLTMSQIWSRMMLRNARLRITMKNDTPLIHHSVISRRHPLTILRLRLLTSFEH